MDKTELLIEKYGLSTEVAKQIVKMFDIELLYQSNELVRPKSNPEKNKEGLAKIKGADPDLKKPAAGVYCMEYKLTRIDFIINGERVVLDDLALVEQIRKLIEINDFEITPKYRKQSTRAYQRKIAQYIIDVLPPGSRYGKCVIACDIFGEFLEKYKLHNMTSPETKESLIENLFVV